MPSPAHARRPKPLNARKPRIVYTVESAPGRDPAKGEKVVRAFLRARLADKP